MKLNLEMNPKRIRVLESHLYEVGRKLNTYVSYDDTISLSRKDTKLGIADVEALLRDWRKLVDALEQINAGENQS